MSKNIPVSPKERPDHESFDTAAVPDFISDASPETGYSPDLDRLDADVYKKLLSGNRLKRKEFVAVVIHVFPEGLITALTPEMGQYYRVYKDIERQEALKPGVSLKDAKASTLVKANADLFMLKARILFDDIDLMIPDPPIYNDGNKLGMKMKSGEELTIDEKRSVKYIALHHTFVGKRGGFLGFGEVVPAVNSRIRVSFDDIDNLLGPQYLGMISTAEGAIDPFAGFPGSISALFGCDGSQGDAPAGGGVFETLAKTLRKTTLPPWAKSELDKVKAEITRIAGKEGDSEEDEQALKALIDKKKELEAKLAAPPPATSPEGGTDEGERREDPTIPPPAQRGLCALGNATTPGALLGNFINRVFQRAPAPAGPMRFGELSSMFPGAPSYKDVGEWQVTMGGRTADGGYGSAITSPVGNRRPPTPGGSKNHNGVDMVWAAPSGQVGNRRQGTLNIPVYSAIDGVVAYVSTFSKGSGGAIIVRGTGKHKGLFGVNYHVHTDFPAVGSQVKAGKTKLATTGYGSGNPKNASYTTQIRGETGYAVNEGAKSTGPHIHYELWELPPNVDSAQVTSVASGLPTGGGRKKFMRLGGTRNAVDRVQNTKLYK